MAIKYRDMEKEEAAATGKLARSCFPFYYRLFMGKFRNAVLAVEDDRIVGGAVYHAVETGKGNFGCLEFGFTAAGNRGKGIGRETYSRALQKLEEKGCRNDGAIVLNDNSASWGLLSDMGFSRGTALSLIPVFGLAGALKIWFETGFPFVPGAELWLRGIEKPQDPGSLTAVILTLVLNLALFAAAGLVHGGALEPVDFAAVTGLLLLRIFAGFIFTLPAGERFSYRFWRSGILIPVIVFLVGGVFPIGGDFYPAKQKWYYNRENRKLGLIGAGSWLAVIAAAAAFILARELWPGFFNMIDVLKKWIYMLLIFHCVPFLLESWPGNRVLHWNRAVFIIFEVVSIGLLVQIFAG